jgi:hypothetical protein
MASVASSPNKANSKPNGAVPGALSPADIKKHVDLRIPAELLVEAHVERVTDLCARDDSHGIKADGHIDCAGVWYPYFSPVTGKRTTGRLRLDQPITDGKGKPHKYLLPWGDPRHLYILPRHVPLLDQKDVRVVLVEAEKSVLALTAWSDRTGIVIIPIGLGGCWSWCGRIGIEENTKGQRVEVHGPLDDLHMCDGHPVLILLDNNAATNPDVQWAREKLLRELSDEA